MHDNKGKPSIFANLFWKFLQSSGYQVASFFISIVLARLLEPSVYGIVAIVGVFTSIMQVFVDSGLGVSLIQKKDVDNIDFSSVFYFNLLMCSVFYVGLFFSAPWIAHFYKLPELTKIVRVMGLSLIIYGVNHIQHSYVSKTLQFKCLFFATLGAVVISSIVGLTIAYLGFGVWALVWQSLANALTSTIILWFTVKWRPTWAFSFKKLKSLYSFGWKIFVSSILNTLYRDLTTLIIGKLYSSKDLAFYQRGAQFPRIISQNINTSIDSVLLPAMATEQDNIKRLKAMTERAIKTSTFIMMPIMGGLAVCSESIVRMVLTDKWLPCLFFFRIFCFTYAFHPVQTANLNAIKALGRSDWFLILEIIKKVVGLVFLLSTIWISVKALACSLLVTNVLAQIINSWPNKKLLNYSYLEQLRDILPQILITGIMIGLVYLIHFFHFNDIVKLCIQIPFGAAFYIIVSLVFKMECALYIKNKVISTLSFGKYHNK